MDEKTKESLRIWDALAPGYDRFRAYMSETESPVTERMLEAMDPREGDTILELTAGAGEVGLMLAERRPDVTVLITDFAPNMVEVSAKAAEKRGVKNVQTRVVDAQAIDLPDRSVDGVMSRFGIMLIPDIPKALSEIRRVLTPGRTLAYAVWGPLETNPWMMMMGATLMQRGHFTPPPGGGFFPLTTEDENRAMVSAAGFDYVDVEIVEHPHIYENFEHYWQMSTSLAGPMVEIVKGLSDEERQAVHDQVQEYSASFRSGDEYRFPSRRIFVRAS